MRTLTTRKKTVVIIAVLVILGFLLFSFLRWLYAPQTAAEYVAPSIGLLESRIIGRKDGRRQWQILAKSLIQEDDCVRLSDMEEIVIFKDEEPHLFVEAETAIWHRKEDILELFEQAVVTEPDRYRLQSDYLIWHGKEETLTSPGPAVLEWKEMYITFDEMVFYVPEERAVLRGNVWVREGQFSCRMEEAVYYVEDEILEFYGDVVSEKKEDSVYGQE